MSDRFLRDGSSMASQNEFYKMGLVNREMRVRNGLSSGDDGEITDGTVRLQYVSIELDDDGPRTFTPPQPLYRSEVCKTMLAFVLLLLSSFLNFFLLVVIHDVVPRQPLPDLVFMLIPQQKWAWSVGDVLSTFTSSVSLLCIILHRHRLVVLRRVMLLGAILYGLRAVVMGVTFLPPSFNDREQICQPQVNRTVMYGMELATRFITHVVTLGLTSGQEKILCGDLMFSGHTLVLATMYFVQLQYTPPRLALLRMLMGPVTYAGIASLVISGGHYTMDILIAYWLTSHVFWTYHQVFELPHDRRSTSPLANLWWFWPCYWFETDVPNGRLSNEFIWPFPKPHCMVRGINALNRALQ